MVNSPLVSQAFQNVDEKYFPKWKGRSTGWMGRTYLEALMFCATEGSRVPCPYEAYCPMGPGKHVMGGMRTEHTFAPIIDTQNGWVSVGPDDTCITHNAERPPPEWGLTGIGSEEITQHIMCCFEHEDGFGIASVMSKKPMIDPDFNASVERSTGEMAAMDRYHPVWYESRHGYHGGSHADAELFCANVGGKRLCPEEAYCPNGVATYAGQKTLFLDQPAFEGEQWAPVGRSDWGDDGGNRWVMVGTVEGGSTSTCSPSTSIASDLSIVHKQHVLCCTDKDDPKQPANIEAVMKAEMRPVWLDRIDGWEGGSWDDAVVFCDGHGGRELCGYSTYCPYGTGQSIMGSHRYDFEAEGVQWAPLSQRNSWVMIGRKYQNSATTCLTFDWLEGSSPGDWGKGDGMAELKRHVMCCMPKG